MRKAIMVVSRSRPWRATKVQCEFASFLNPDFQEFEISTAGGSEGTEDMAFQCTQRAYGAYGEGLNFPGLEVGDPELMWGQADAEHDLQRNRIPLDLRRLEEPVGQCVLHQCVDPRVWGFLHRDLLHFTVRVQNC